MRTGSGEQGGQVGEGADDGHPFRGGFGPFCGRGGIPSIEPHPEKSGAAGIRLLSNWIDGLGAATL